MTDYQNEYTVNIVDTGIFRAHGKPPNGDFETFGEAIQTADQSATLTWDIYRELGGNPESNPPPSESDWVAPGMEDGWIVLGEQLEPTEVIENVLDAAQRGITNLMPHPKTATADEDASLVGLAAQYFENSRSIHVIIHTTDRALAETAVRIIEELGYHDIAANYIPPGRVVDRIGSVEQFRPWTADQPETE